MEPKMVGREAFTIVGAQVRGYPTELDYRGLWETRFMPRHDEVKALSTDGAYYGAFFQTGEPGVVEHVAGMAVPPGTKPPEGFVAREVPAATYAVFECTTATLSATWNAIMGEWLSAGPYELDASAAGFEYYPPGTSGEGSPVWVYVPVRGKAG